MEQKVCESKNPNVSFTMVQSLLLRALVCSDALSFFGGYSIFSFVLKGFWVCQLGRLGHLLLFSFFSHGHNLTRVCFNPLGLATYTAQLGFFGCRCVDGDEIQDIFMGDVHVL